MNKGMLKAREWLDEIERLRTQIGLFSAEYDAACKSINLLPGVTYDGIHVQVSTKDNRILAQIEELTDKLHRLSDGIRELEQVRSERVEMIKRLREPGHIEVLYLRYVKGLYFWEVAQEMKISERNVYYLHNGALAELWEVMQKWAT